MTEGIFNEGNESIASALEQLVGEGKKFADVEALAAGKLKADDFIKQLETETEGLRKDIGEGVNASKLLEEIRSLKKEPIAPVENTTPPVSQEGLADLVSKAISDKEVLNTKQANVSAVDAMMLEKFGDKAKEVFVQKANALGLSVDYLKGIAADSPQAFFNMLSVNEKPEGAPRGAPNSINTEAFMKNSSGDKEDSAEYYTELRRKDPAKFWTPAVQNKIMKAAEGKMFG
jgi:hypothetical protein